MIQPIFVDGELEGWAATMAHHSDVGGLAPGSIAVHATEIYQEGLRMPLLKLFDAGAQNTTLFRVIEKNTRQPVHVLGDLRAQVAACAGGRARADRHPLAGYGAPAARDYMDELQRLGERLMRAEIAALPDGEYGFVDWIDGVGEDPEPLRIEVLLRVAGDELSIDFTGTAPQVEASVNCPVGLVNSPPATARSRGSRSARSRTARAICARSGSTRPRGRSSTPCCPPRAARAG